MKMIIRYARNEHILLLSVLCLFIFPGCSTHKPITLMPTPVLFHNGSVDPFAHMDEYHKSTTTHVFYATNRAQEISDQKIGYGNRVSSKVHLGKAIIRFGNPEDTWEDLYRTSLSETHNVSIPITHEAIDEIATASNADMLMKDGLIPELQTFIDAINKELLKAVDKEIMVYVHGTKVDFNNAIILTAEIDHFAGRDFVSLGFAWPSHQNILSYLSGTDVQRALNSSPVLTRLLVLLAEHTTAEHINLLAYSAGGKVTSKALFDLFQDFNNLEAQALREKFRIGAVVFAAADVEVDVFLKRIPAISTLADQVVVTVTDDDYALKAAKRFMGGKVRAGSTEAEVIEEVFIVSHNLANVEIIDVSSHKEIRGFDIIGHHYWYRHPWMSSDIVFLMRTNLPPSQRGLSPSELEGVWYLSADYPEKIRQAAETELEGQW